MKALILAAGFGTRLLPFTQHTPKALFTISGRPLIDITIKRLCLAGIEAVMINTHHLGDQLQSHVAGRDYGIPVYVRYEAEILGTGGAIKNVADFWDDEPFIVINGDIVSDIDLKEVYRFHTHHPYWVTLVLADDPDFNTVTIDDNQFITALKKPPNGSPPTRAGNRLTFTGIHILNPELLNFIPDKGYSDIIDVYSRLLTQRIRLKAFKPANGNWRDLGTPQRYAETVFEKMSAQAFEKFTSPGTPARITKNKLKGDGSDRKWYRLTTPKASLVMVDHGLRMPGRKNEADAFVAIGKHLHAHGIPVPKILLFDTFAGLVFLEDLGDTNLQMVVRQAKGSKKIISSYQAVMDSLIEMCLSGAEGFDPSWTCQSSAYSRKLILEKECRYFMEAFVCGYVGIEANYEDLAPEFGRLADGALKNAVTGFMHRDLQSRNIMYKDGRFYFIDFQGGRLGPLQYDLASLLIDPYVGLTHTVQNQLFEYGFQKLRPLVPMRPDEFKASYQYCCITRNLQILGAFGYLSRIKQKTYFEYFIPRALETLRYNLSQFDNDEFPQLKMLVGRIKNTLNPQRTTNPGD